MRRVVLSTVLFLTLPAFSQAKHPFTFEDMMKLKRVSEPVPSPDGKWVLFSAVDVDLAANKKTPYIWIVPLNANHERKADSSASRDASPSAPVGMTSSDGSMTGVQSSLGEGRAPSPVPEHVLIADQDGDRPRWAPDGKRFAFISAKEGGSQVWIADFDGSAGTISAVHKLTAVATEASGELWSPDGKYILFVSDVYPECDGTPEAETTCNAKTVKEVEESKVKALIFDHLLYRHWNAYKAGKRSHIFVVPAPTLPKTGEGWGTPISVARDLTPGDHDAPVFSLGGQDDYAFSPDGQELCYTSNHDKAEAISTNNDLWTVPVNWDANATPAQVLAKTKNITADNPASDSTPRYSPDGRHIAYRAQQRPGYESDRFRLMLYDRRTGAKNDLTEAFDQWAGSFAWAPDSKTIYFSSEHKRHSLIYAMGGLSADKGAMGYARSLVPGFDDDLAVTPDGKKLVFSRQSIAAPNEIYASDAAGDGCPSKTGDVDPGKESCWLNKEWPLTHINDQLLSPINMGVVEPFWFKGAHNDSVEGTLVKPPNFDPSKKYPVKFLIHGGPQGAWGDDWSYRWNPELFAANGYVVIMINFHGSTGYGQKFIDSINGDWGGAPFEDLMKGLDYAEKNYPFIDKDRECALGASFGGYMINWILGHTDRFKCLVSHDGTFNNESDWGSTEELWFNEWEFHGTPYTNRELYRKWSPHLFATNFKTPTLVIHGQFDYRIDVSEGFQLFTTLERLGVPSKMLYFPDEGHWVLKPQNSQLWYKTVNDWVERWVGKK